MAPPDDGIVRVINHGTDHSTPGAGVGDSPLYTQLGYSTATSPLLDEEAWTTPLEQAVVLVDAQGRASHRAGMTLLGTRIDGRVDGRIDGQIEDGGEAAVGVAGSIATAHLLDPVGRQRRFGPGLEGVATPLGRVEVQSLVRGPWEVRLVRVLDLEPGVDAAAMRLRMGGWAVSGASVSGTSISREHGARAASGRLTTTLAPLLGDARADVVVRRDASPLGPESAVPTLEYAVEIGVWIAALVELRGVPASAPTASLDLDLDEDGVAVVSWPDGVLTTSRLFDS